MESLTVFLSFDLGAPPFLLFGALHMDLFRVLFHFLIDGFHYHLAGLVIIELRGMHFTAFHGCLEEEKEYGNEFTVDFRCRYGITPIHRRSFAPVRAVQQQLDLFAD